MIFVIKFFSHNNLDLLVYGVWCNIYRKYMVSLLHLAQWFLFSSFESIMNSFLYFLYISKTTHFNLHCLKSLSYHYQFVNKTCLFHICRQDATGTQNIGVHVTSYIQILLTTYLTQFMQTFPVFLITTLFRYRYRPYLKLDYFIPGDEWISIYCVARRNNDSNILCVFVTSFHEFDVWLQVC